MSYSVAFMMDGGIVDIKQEEGIVVTMNRPLTADEMAVAGTINEMLARLRNGKFVSYDFDPRSFEDAQSIIKCEWLRSGALKIHGPTPKPYHHCESVDLAVKEHRTFTCLRSLLAFLPPSREERRK